MTGSKVSSRARMYERTFLPFFLSPILSSPPFSPSHVHAPFVDIPWHVLDPFRKMLSSQLGEERKLKWYHSVTKESAGGIRFRIHSIFSTRFQTSWKIVQKVSKKIWIIIADI